MKMTFIFIPFHFSSVWAQFVLLHTFGHPMTSLYFTLSTNPEFKSTAGKIL